MDFMGRHVNAACVQRRDAETCVGTSMSDTTHWKMLCKELSDALLVHACCVIQFASRSAHTINPLILQADFWLMNRISSEVAYFGKQKGHAQSLL